jgi:two-component system chemotaxis sensor kinase CheA
MNSFVEKFKEEVKEYLERIESGLLLLEQDHTNDQVISEIFRLMHSMKGSGGMFGFNLLSDVTHDLESLYDLFRTKKHSIDDKVIGFTLKSIDGLRQLLVQEPSAEDESKAQKMKSDTQSQITRLTSVGFSNEVIEAAPASAKTISTDNQTTYFISFVPDEHILTNGTNPLYLIDELNALGACNIQVSFDSLPALEEIEPDKCYTSWYLFIATAENSDTINDVFIFVGEQADVQIEKVCDGNIVHDEKIMAQFLNARQNQEIWIPDESELSMPGTSVNSENIIEKDLPDESSNPVKESTKVPVFMPNAVDSIKVDSQKIDHYMNLISELITAQSHLEELSYRIKNVELDLVTETFGKLGRQLRENAFDMSLIPLQSVAVRFNRLIHDLSKSLVKEVVFVTEGMDTELDKNIIEKLLEPLLHIIRNSMDHGIESKAVRIENNKNPTGTISIKASTVGSSVQIELEDDGAGLDAEQIRAKAIAKGMKSEITGVPDNEIYYLIFEPGFSTSKLVTDVSGRGVGMDVVRRRVQEMRGSIELITEKGKFTRFTLKLPLSLSIIDGLLTSVGNSYYVIPSSSVRKIYNVKPDKLKKGFRQVIELEGSQLPYLNMHEEFENQNPLPENLYLVAVSHENQLFGLVVDEVIREYQAVIKPLGRLLKGQDVFSGASILGTGQLALVIDTNRMIQKYS